MKKSLICTIILFSYLSLCPGCENKQKKDDRTTETMIQKADSMSSIVDKTNLKKEDILSWEYDQAIARLGEPIFRNSFPIREANGLSVSLHNHLSKHPEDSSMLVRELLLLKQMTKGI